MAGEIDTWELPRMDAATERSRNSLGWDSCAYFLAGFADGRDRSSLKKMQIIELAVPAKHQSIQKS